MIVSYNDLSGMGSLHLKGENLLLYLQLVDVVTM